MCLLLSGVAGTRRGFIFPFRLPLRLHGKGTPHNSPYFLSPADVQALRQHHSRWKEAQHPLLVLSAASHCPSTKLLGAGQFSSAAPIDLLLSEACAVLHVGSARPSQQRPSLCGVSEPCFQKQARKGCASLEKSSSFPRPSTAGLRGSLWLLYTGAKPSPFLLCWILSVSLCCFASQCH